MALFKIYNNIDNPRKDANNEPILPSTYNKGYMYFDAQTKRFFIDLAGDGGSTGTRVAVNAYGAEKAYSDINGDQIDTTYLKTADAGNINVASANKVNHTLTFGANQEYVYDGSSDVTVPVYTGAVV